MQRKLFLLSIYISGITALSFIIRAPGPGAQPSITHDHETDLVNGYLAAE